MSVPPVSLPIDDFLSQARDLFARHQNLVLTAEPGAGKTTRIPPALLTEVTGKILVLEPRRIAAVSAAARIAEERGWELGGDQVGYQVRFDNKSSKNTRLIFLTEALLTRKMLADPDLKDVSCVILDEFHERSLHTDVAIALLKELQELSRPDLKIVVMSATLETKKLTAYLATEALLKVPGKTFPLQTHYENKTMLLRTGPDFTDRLSSLTLSAFGAQAGADVLVFLPGRGEIERVGEKLRARLGDSALVLPLHGSLTLDEQRRALLPHPQKRKIILATNVAESSLTVQGVSTVVDSGLARVNQLHPKTGFESLDLQRVSLASATQRAGRAARTGPGHVYRAWSVHDEISMKDFETPEIHRSELSETVLLLAALGLTRPENVSWFEQPSPGALKTAGEFLRFIGALTTEGALTDLGSRMRRLPLHPRLAKLLLLSEDQGTAELGAELATLLSEKIPSGNSHHGQENDLFDAWESWRRDPSRFRLLDKTKRQLLQTLSSKTTAREPSFVDWAPAMLLEIYPDRLCRRRRMGEASAKMVGGRGVKLHPSSSVKQSEYFLALDVVEGAQSAETTVHRAVGVPTALVEKAIKPKAKPDARVEWNEDARQFQFVQSYTWQNLEIGNENRRPAKPDEITDQLARLAGERWDDLLKDNDALAAWIKRLEFLVRLEPKFASEDPSPIPALSQAKFAEGLELATYGESSLKAVGAKNLISFFEPLFDGDVMRRLEKDCPSTWVVPSGSRMKIQYSDEQGPFCEVRLQELFGLAESPTVAGQKLTLFLLGPNYRPVQVTRDLASFWKNGYVEVRKEMKTRYPKHSWPENPLEAPAVAKGRSTRSH
ncbi:MAG: ATP-dependent helicase HrpB [Bdellovibrionaceae bacterium]|nr:ATP-dependent helicase HrpB [Pseudobdellovibrionaceae bacterium]